MRFTIKQIAALATETENIAREGFQLISIDKSLFGGDMLVDAMTATRAERRTITPLGVVHYDC